MSDISKIHINPTGGDHNIKDATARNAIQSSKTIKSSVVTVNDAAPINAEDITVDITPQQDLHGYDRPWAGGAWKNKLNYIDFKGVEGGTVTKSNGTLTITGTNGRTGANITGSLVNNLPAGTYTLSFNVVSITNYQNQPTFFGFIVKKSGGAYVYSSVSVSQTGTKSLTYTLSEGDKFERIDFNINDQSSALSNACTFEIKDIQVEEGSQATTFAPYSNECPIEGWTGAELDRVEGYFDGRYPNIDTSVKYRAIQVGNGTFTMSSDARGNNSFALLFFLAGNVSSGASSANNGVYNGHPVTVTTNDGYVTVGYRTGSAGSQTPVGTHTKIEKGAVATPYQGQQYTASFGETVHGGKWHVTAGGTDKTHANIANYNGETINEPWLSSMDEYVAGATPTTGAQVVYPLTTPTTISTPKQNVLMLQGINTVYADCGDTSLKYQPDNVVGELKGEIEDNIIYEDFKWTTNSSQSYSAGTPGTYGTSSWRDVKKEGYDVIGVTFVENRRFGDCILTLNYIPSTSHVEVIIFRATSSAVTIADEDIAYRVAYKKA